MRSYAAHHLASLILSGARLLRQAGNRAAAAGDDHLVAFLDRLDMLGEVMVGLAQPDRVAHGSLM